MLGILKQTAKRKIIFHGNCGGHIVPIPKANRAKKFWHHLNEGCNSSESAETLENWCVVIIDNANFCSVGYSQLKFSTLLRLL